MDTDNKADGPFCVVAGKECIAPSGWVGSSGRVFLGDKTTRTTCHRCGLPVCIAATCSRIRYGHRVCTDCLDQRARENRRKDFK